MNHHTKQATDEALAAACQAAAWAKRPATVAAAIDATAKAGIAAADSDPRAGRNAPPVTLWEALRRLLDCNKGELAERLGVSRHTLQRWERGELPERASGRVAELMQETLHAAGAGWTTAPLFRPTAFKRGPRAAKPPG